MTDITPADLHVKPKVVSTPPASKNGNGGNGQPDRLANLRRTLKRHEAGKHGYANVIPAGCPLCNPLAPKSLHDAALDIIRQGGLS